MNRSFKDYAMAHHRRGIAGNTLPADSDHHLDLFSRNRRIISHDTSQDRITSLRLGKISVGSVKSSRSGLDDLLTSTDAGKHDYDWLLTPPETPVFPSAEGNEFHQSFTAPRRSSAARSVSTTKSSRLSTTRVESNISSRPARSSSVTRTSVSYTQSSSSYYSNIKSSSSILNTSSASVSSYIRPSSPITRSSSSTRPSTPARTTPSRSSTPSKSRSVPTPTLSSSIDKPRPSYGLRPSTPSSRPQISSRPSTPTRRSTITSSSVGLNNNISSSTVRALSNNGRSQTSSTSRPSSPNPSRVRSQQSIIPPDFSLDTPPNLRTTLPDRPVSAGRSRPVGNATITAKVNAESQGGNGNFQRRASSPLIARGRSVEPKSRSQIVQSNGHASDVQEPRRSSSYVSESPSRRNIRAPTTTTTDNNVLGRTISKKPLDMAIKHMDLRDGSGSMRPLTGTVRYPQSMRSAMSKINASQTLKNSASGDVNGRLSVSNNNGFLQQPENGKYNHNGALENGRRREQNGRLLFERLNEVDMFESSRYDAILLKEDLKNTNWLLSADEKSDQGLIFEPGFEYLPEPFGLS